jgi:hypothetical protein
MTGDTNKPKNVTYLAYGRLTKLAKDGTLLDFVYPGRIQRDAWALAKDANSIGEPAGLMHERFTYCRGYLIREYC